MSELFYASESECLIEDDAVSEGDECPGCGEWRIDRLAWDDEGTIVMCQSCGREYLPPNLVINFDQEPTEE